MSIVKSYSVSKGDMFYIENNHSLTIINSCLLNEKQNEIIKELKDISSNKEETNFMSTILDENHIYGIEKLVSNNIFDNFFCVKNQVTKNYPSLSFKKYCELRDNKNSIELDNYTEINYFSYINDFGSFHEDGFFIVNIKCLWPNTNNKHFQEELKKVKNGKKPNNISPIILHKSHNNSIMWFGDMEAEFLEKIIDDINLPKVDILFITQHGRNSNKIPKYILDKISPKIIIIGESDSLELNYYQGYNTITQNSSGDILLINDNYNEINIYVSNKNYTVNFLINKEHKKIDNFNYIGTLTK